MSEINAFTTKIYPINASESIKTDIDEHVDQSGNMASDQGLYRMHFMGGDICQKRN